MKAPLEMLSLHTDAHRHPAPKSATDYHRRYLRMYGERVKKKPDKTEHHADRTKLAGNHARLTYDAVFE